MPLKNVDRMPWLFHSLAFPRAKVCQLLDAFSRGNAPGDLTTPREHTHPVSSTILTMVWKLRKLPIKKIICFCCIYGGVGWSSFYVDSINRKLPILRIAPQSAVINRLATFPVGAQNRARLICEYVFDDFDPAVS